MTTVIARNGIILADRQTTIQWPGLPGFHRGFRAEFEFISNGTDKITIVEKGDLRLKVTTSETVRAFAHMGLSKHNETMLGIMQATDLDSYLRGKNAAKHSSFGLSLFGILQSGKLFHYRSVLKKPDTLDIFDDDPDQPLSNCAHGSGGDVIYEMNRYANCIQTPLEGMVMANLYDAGTGSTFDYFNTHTNTYQTCVQLTEKQREHIIRRVESRIKLRRDPVERSPDLGIKEKPEDYHSVTL